MLHCIALDRLGWDFAWNDSLTVYWACAGAIGESLALECIILLLLVLLFATVWTVNPSIPAPVP